MMPFQSVNQIRLEAAYAVPTPSLPPWVHRGRIPGCPNAPFLLSDIVIIPPVLQLCQVRSPRVMSSRLCKKVEGAVFPFQVESLEDGVDDAVDAGHIHETDHGPGSSSHFHEAALDHVGGSHL